MGWFTKKKPEPVPAEANILVPFRFAEAARISIYTIGARPELPDAIRWWIAQWLVSYNQYLVNYMQETYGPDIFPALDEITRDVMPDLEEIDDALNHEDPAWDMWESEFKEEDQ